MHLVLVQTISLALFLSHTHTRPHTLQIGPNTVLVQFDQRHRRSAGFGNVKFRTIADAQRAVAMAAATDEGGLVIDGAAVTVVPAQVIGDIGLLLLYYWISCGCVFASWKALCFFRRIT